jgi:hypothetical protein
MSETKKEFQGVWIPKEICAIEGLTPAEKLVLGHMLGFQSFFAGDGHMSAKLGINRRTFERIVCSLRFKGYVKGRWGDRQPTTLGSVLDYARMSSQTTLGSVQSYKPRVKLAVSNPKRTRSLDEAAPKPTETNAQYVNRLYKQAGMKY